METAGHFARAGDSTLMQLLLTCEHYSPLKNWRSNLLEAVALRRENRYKESAALLERTLEDIGRFSGTTAVLYTCQVTIELALVYARWYRYDEAIRLVESALSRCDTWWGKVAYYRALVQIYRLKHDEKNASQTLLTLTHLLLNEGFDAYAETILSEDMTSYGNRNPTEAKARGRP